MFLLLFLNFFRLLGIAHVLRDSLFFINGCSFQDVKSKKNLKLGYLGTAFKSKTYLSEERKTAYEDLDVKSNKSFA